MFMDSWTQRPFYFVDFVNFTGLMSAQISVLLTSCPFLIFYLFNGLFIVVQRLYEDFTSISFSFHSADFMPAFFRAHFNLFVVFRNFFFYR